MYFFILEVKILHKCQKFPGIWSLKLSSLFFTRHVEEDIKCNMILNTAERLRPLKHNTQLPSPIVKQVPQLANMVFPGEKQKSATFIRSHLFLWVNKQQK